MEIHGIRPELQPSAIAKASENTSQATVNQNVVQEAIETNHDAPGIDEVDISSITGLGASLNITA